MSISPTHEAQKQLDESLKDVLKMVDEMFQASNPNFRLPAENNEIWQGWCDRYDRAQEIREEFGVKYLSRKFV